MSYITLHDVTVTYGEGLTEAISNVSLSLEKHSFTMFVGPNGAGKSTLLKAILGIIPYTGTISFSKEISDSIEMGYVPQKFQFDRTVPLTVEELLLSVLVNCSHTPSQQKEMVLQSLINTQSDHLLHKRVGSLSGGEMQRVLLARALVHNPKILVLDEPEQGVDPSGEQTFYELLKKLALTHEMTILAASHELELVSKFADMVVCMHKTVHCVGKPHEVLNQKTFASLYGSSVAFIHHNHGDH